MGRLGTHGALQPLAACWIALPTFNSSNKGRAPKAGASTRVLGRRGGPRLAVAPWVSMPSAMRCAPGAQIAPSGHPGCALPLQPLPSPAVGLLRTLALPHDRWQPALRRTCRPPAAAAAPPPPATAPLPRRRPAIWQPAVCGARAVAQPGAKPGVQPRHAGHGAAVGGRHAPPCRPAALAARGGGGRLARQQR